MPNSVQGVQAVVQAFVQAYSHMRRGLCRVCRGFPYVTCARQANNHPTKNKTASRVYGTPAHPAHPAQTTHRAASRFFAPCTTACTPCTTHLITHFFKKIMKIVCGKENVTDFNRQFKAVAPEFYNLAKELHTAGLISGLRGATLEFAPLTEQSAMEPPKAPRHCKTCGHWHIPMECSKQGATACAELGGS